MIGAQLARSLLALTLAASSLRAQSTATLSSRLDKPTFAAVSAILDSARRVNLPTKPLVDKALEGAAKGSDGPTIVTAVQQLSLRMSSARDGLGPGASNDEIRAGVSALEAGVAPHYLARLRSVAGKRSVTMPLAVVSDLIARNVSVPAASDLVLQLARAGVTDTELATFQRNVRADIDHGADPTVAATTRARGLVSRPRGSPKPPALQ